MLPFFIEFMDFSLIWHFSTARKYSTKHYPKNFSAKIGKCQKTRNFFNTRFSPENNHLFRYIFYWHVMPWLLLGIMYRCVAWNRFVERVRWRKYSIYSISLEIEIIRSNSILPTKEINFKLIQIKKRNIVLLSKYHVVGRP